MAYDVFVVSALEDRDMANLVVRRLRALKFKCWFDKKQTDTTFDQKDARNALNSQSMLVLWSKDAVVSDWVRAAASVGNSRPGMLLEIGLDDTIPYEPFSINKRHSLQGMTTRTTVEGFYEIIEELGRRDGRTDLREWLQFGKDDEDKKAAWLENHPSDPLALAEAKKREKEAEQKEAPKAAAALATTAAVSAPAKPIQDEAIGEDGVIGSGYGPGVGKVPGTPGAPYVPGRKGPAGVYASPPASEQSAEPAPVTANSQPADGLGRWMIAGILIGIFALFLLSGLLRTSPAQLPSNVPSYTASAAYNTAAGSSAIIQIADTCPAGYISSHALAAPAPEDTKEDEE